MFGLNRAEVIGRLGADVTINHLTSGGRVANLSIATDGELHRPQLRPARGAHPSGTGSSPSSPA